MSINRTFPKSVQPGIPRIGDKPCGWNRGFIGAMFEEVKRPLDIVDDEKYRLVTVRRSRGGIAARSELFGKEILVKSQFYIRSGDFLISKRQIVHGACAIVTDEFDGAIVSNEYSVLRCKEKLLLDYLAQLFHSIYFQQTFFHSSTGVHIEKMIFKLGDWFGWPVNVPPLKEQQKIAKFLTSIDTKIEQLSKKKSLWEQYKKGMMQKLFSQELRFKDESGGDYPDWVEKRLGEVYEFKSTNSLSRDKLNYKSGSVYNLHYGDIHTKFKSEFNLLNEKVPFINSDVELMKISEDKYCKQGDLVIADASEDYDDIGKTVELVDLNGQKVLAGLHTLLARLVSKDMYVGYGAFVMACFFVRKQIKIIAQGTKVLGLSAGRVANINLPIPSKNEQQKIADFLSSIDSKIELIDTELKQAQTFKKGLLQQMFV